MYKDRSWLDPHRPSARPCAAAFGAVAQLEPANQYLDRVLRMQLPIYVALLGRWEEIWAAAHDPQSPWWNPGNPAGPSWPFEQSKRGAFAHFVDIFNRTGVT